MTDPTAQVVDEARNFAASRRRLENTIRAATAAGATPRDVENALRRAAAGRPDFRQPIDDLIRALAT